MRRYVSTLFTRALPVYCIASAGEKDTEMRRRRGELKFGSGRWISLTVSVIVIHLRQHVDCVRVEGEARAIHDSKRVQLMAKSALAEHELGRVRAIQTINAVRPTYPVLKHHLTPPRPMAFSARDLTIEILAPLPIWTVKIVRIGFRP